MQQHYELTSIPELLTLATYVSKDGTRPSLEREAHRTHKLYMPQYRGTPGPKNENGWVGKWGEVWGTFGIALEMSLRKIRNKKKKKKIVTESLCFSGWPHNILLKLFL